MFPALAVAALFGGGLTGCADEGYYEIGPGNWYEEEPVANAVDAAYEGGLDFGLDVAYYEAACDNGGTAGDASDDYWYSLVYAPGMIHYYWPGTPGILTAVASAEASATVVVNGLASNFSPDFWTTGASSADLVGLGLVGEAGEFYDYVYAEFYSIGGCEDVAAQTDVEGSFGEVAFFFQATDMVTGDAECGATDGINIATGLYFGTSDAISTNMNIVCGNY